MYILKNKIINVKRFLINKSDVVIIKANKEILLNNRILDIDDLISVSFLNTEIDFFLLLNLKNKKLMCDKNLKKLHQFNKNTLIYDEIVYQNQNNKLTSIDTQFNTDGSIVYNWIILNVLENKIVKILNLKNNIFGFFYTHKDTVIYRTNNENDKISAFDYLNNKPLWQFDLSQLGSYYHPFHGEMAYKVEKMIGIWQNILLVACSGHLLLAIDIETGKIIHQWKDEGNFAIEPNQKILFASNFVLDEKNEILFSFTWHYHLIINLKTQELTVVDMADELSKYALSSLKYNLDYATDETYVYTTARVDTDKLNIDYHQEALIAIHRENKTIDWIYIFEEAPLGTNTPRLSGNKLYQLDLDGNLHIFEKQNNENV